MKRPSISRSKATKASRGKPGAAVTIKKILVPTDFSPGSGKALKYAAALAAQFDAAITLLHIAEVGSMGYEHGAADFPRMEAQLRVAAEKEIADCLKGDIAVGIKVGRGRPFGGKRAYHEIVETARKQRTDLIVISTHGLSGLDRLIMGSTAERVVRHARCPVLVVRDRGHEGARTKSTRRGKPESWPFLLP
jgi:nucleotide-binding universal stress UspA family protein